MKIKDIAQQEKLVFAFTLFFVTILFIFLSPKLSSDIFPFKRTFLLSSYIKNVSTQRKIDGQSYWQFREFYSSGSFELSKKGFPDSYFSKVGINPKSTTEIIPILYFSSREIKSLDCLVPTNDLSRYIDIQSISETTAMGRNFIIFRNGEKTKIAFLLPISEFQKANGFIDFTSKDKDLVKGKFWLNLSSIN